MRSIVTIFLQFQRLPNNSTVTLVHDLPWLFQDPRLRLEPPDPVHKVTDERVLPRDGELRIPNAEPQGIYVGGVRPRQLPGERARPPCQELPVALGEGPR